MPASEPITTMAAYLVPGQSIKVKAPVSPKNAQGWVAAADDGIPAGQFDDMPQASQRLTRGFAVENETVGTFSIAGLEEAATVVYTHRVSSKNTIWFFAYSGEAVALNIIAVPIHDHSSIIQGGPAYGTYFDDDEEA